MSHIQSRLTKKRWIMSRVPASTRIRGIVAVFLPFLALFFIACGTTLYPTFSHQGKLLDSSGNPVADGNYTVMYRLYHESSGGTPVFTDTNTVAVTDGYFNSDFGASSADPKIFAEQTWLEITVNGETLTPRQFLRGAPYASGLVAGSAAVGSQPVTYTYSAYDNLGSAFFAANTDSSDTGGSGLTAVTTAQIPESSSYKTDVAAVRGLAVDYDSSLLTGSYAGIFVSEDYRGIYADGGGNSGAARDWYAAYFEGNIYVTGDCYGCAVALTSQNAGDTVIEPGDFVTAVGVVVDPDYDIPILQVRKATANDTILGVADSAMSRGAYREDALTQVGYDIRDGSINKNDYLSVVTEGVVQARLSQETVPAIGDFITAEGVATASNINSVAQVMSEADESGLQWVLLNR
jgi:hypothetical protein